jgi:hypothetical protein
LQWIASKTSAEVRVFREDVMCALETAGAQMCASGACRAWLGSCDDVTRGVAGGVNGPLFTQLLQATEYVDVDCVELFRGGTCSVLLFSLFFPMLVVFVCRRSARGRTTLQRHW